MFAELLRSKLAGIYELSSDQIAQLEQHYELLTRWNKVVNLTAIRTLEDAIERHYCESVFAAKHLPAGAFSVADIGSGAGFPGIPLAIARPECKIALIESHRRKAVFLQEATREFSAVRVIVQRAGEVEERFDWVVSRAVRVSKVAADLTRLADHAEILSGPEEATGTGFAWEAPIKLPWGQRRFLWIGNVPRETLERR